MRRSPRRTNSTSSSSTCTSLQKYDLYNYNASNARALLTCYTKAKPRPSKWDDAHKWLSRAPDDEYPGRRRSSGADDRLLLPWASLADGETKRVVDTASALERQRCVPPTLRDVGTEMTPAGSKEPSRMNTPRAAYARVPPASPPRRREGGALDLDAVRESVVWRDPAAGPRFTAVSTATAWGEAERAKHIAR